MRHHHSILISPGRFPAHDGVHPRPGMPKPRIRQPIPHGLMSARSETIR
jgi:hypothetical protein